VKNNQCKLDHISGFKIPKHTVKLRKTNRLFLPLDNRWYQLFREGKKKWELRGYSDIFNLRTIREGKTVEIRRGYNSHSLWGIIDESMIVNSIDDIPQNILDETIPPEVRNDPDVMNFLQDYEKKYDRYILFKIRLVEEDNDDRSLSRQDNLI